MSYVLTLFFKEKMLFILLALQVLWHIIFKMHKGGKSCVFVNTHLREKALGGCKSLWAPPEVDCWWQMKYLSRLLPPLWTYLLPSTRIIFTQLCCYSYFSFFLLFCFAPSRIQLLFLPSIIFPLSLSNVCVLQHEIPLLHLFRQILEVIVYSLFLNKFDCL